MRPDPSDATPIFLAVVICVLIALIAALAPGARAITAMPSSFDVNVAGWAMDETHARAADRRRFRPSPRPAVSRARP